MKALLLLLSLGLVLQTGLANAKRYEEIGGRHQGDIVLTDSQKDAEANGGTTIVQDAYKWVKGIVPYTIDRVFSTSQVEQILLAMEEISSRSCVRFVEHAKHREFLNITGSPTGCWATLGMNVLSNQLNLDPAGCLGTGEIVHQLLHVLGLTHPQSRPDRDLYVLVQQDAVDPTQAPNLQKYQQGVIEDFGIPYDYESILHCQSDAFGSPTSGRSSVVPLNDVEIGQREALSLKDVRKLNKMYDYEFCGICVRGHCQ
ncbi:astacin-like metalloendopeptidase [Anopheles ziemanni]|uniref:astacin-like metalloendopeptidase n=1 Tax=Anopheles coustani TaxID=139045 RepID=UPI0026586173|nr:astacin-like metalloendopeptidase [Anopheles coustani]XP_058170174.1 astacin-like metalloendopeptidase [Anopheles ziemanni]